MNNWDSRQEMTIVWGTLRVPQEYMENLFKLVSNSRINNFYLDRDDLCVSCDIQDDQHLDAVVESFKDHVESVLPDQWLYRTIDVVDVGGPIVSVYKGRYYGPNCTVNAYYLM